jgi:hypothetical protein
VRIALDALLVLAVAAAVAGGGLLVFEPVSPWGLLYAGAPIALAVALVVARRYSFLKAAVAGALVTGGVILVFVLPGLTYKWLAGDWASGPDCDGFCMSNDGGFVFALFILAVIAVPLAVAGGIISAVASLAGTRRVAE